MFRKLLAAAASIALAGCASGYADFYTQVPGATAEAVAATRAAPAPAMPVVEHMNPSQITEALANYERRGYSEIGYSAFNSGHSENDKAAIAQGIKVGADLVAITDPQYTGTVTSSIPITTPTTSTTYYSGTATAYGPGGTVNAYGNGTATTYGSRTTYIPMSVNRSDYGAAYFVRRKIVLGVYTDSLNDLQRQALQSNHGVVVRSVIDGTPAFNADIVPGDILLSINGVALSSPDQFTEALHAAGSQADIVLLRNGQSVTKHVALNQ